MLSHPKPAVRRQGEVRNALFDAQGEYLPSMREHLDLDRIWSKARRRALRDLVDPRRPVPKIPGDNPFTLDQLIDDDADVDALLGLLTDLS